MKSQTFLGGIFVLVIGSLVAKLLGAFYRIPLTWVLGAEGLGIYQLVFPVFSLLLVLSSTGTPTAISTMVAGRIKEGKYLEAEKIFRISKYSLLIFGIITGAVLALSSGILASIQGNELSTYSYVAIAFAVPMVSILSAFRGYYQGCRNMVPTALSQVVEQAGKLIFGLILSFILIPYGIEFGALGAVLGVVLGEILAVIIMYIYKIFNRKKENFKLLIQNNEVADNKLLAKELGKIAMPIVVASFVIPALQVIDSMLVVNLLNMGGYNTAEATIMWGINSGVVNSIINMPVVLALAVATAVVPELSEKTKVIGETAKEKIASAHNFTINIALPCVMGLMILAPLIINFLYSDSLGTNSALNEQALATNLLVFSSALILIMALMQVQNASLQGIGKANIPLRHIIFAGIIKIVLMIVFVQIREINIYGVFIANMVFYSICFILNSVYLWKTVQVRDCYSKLLPTIVASCVMTLALIMARMAFVNLNVYIAFPIDFVLGVIVYAWTLLIMGGAGEMVVFIKKFWQKVYKRKVL